jgi:hypothetical protein
MTPNEFAAARLKWPEVAQEQPSQLPAAESSSIRCNLSSLR